MSGDIPAELGGLANLVGLSFEGCKVSGAIPDEFGRLTRLQELYLDINELSGIIPSSLGNLTELVIALTALRALDGRFLRQVGGTRGDGQGARPGGFHGRPGAEPETNAKEVEAQKFARDLVAQMKPAAQAIGMRNLLIRVVDRGGPVTTLGAGPGIATTLGTPGYGLTVRADRPAYRVGEAIRLSVSTTRDCRACHGRRSMRDSRARLRHTSCHIPGSAQARSEDGENAGAPKSGWHAHWQHDRLRG